MTRSWAVAALESACAMLVERVSEERKSAVRKSCREILAGMTTWRALPLREREQMALTTILELRAAAGDDHVGAVLSIKRLVDHVLQERSNGN